VWDKSLDQLGDVCRAVEAAAEGDFSNINPKYLTPRLIGAHYGFASLADAGISADLTQPLADATKVIFEALEASDSEAFDAGMKSASAVAAKIVGQL